MVHSCHPHLHSHAIKAFVAAAIQQLSASMDHCVAADMGMHFIQSCLQHVRMPSKTSLLSMCTCFSLQHATSVCRKHTIHARPFVQCCNLMQNIIAFKCATVMYVLQYLLRGLSHLQRWSIRVLQIAALYYYYKKANASLQPTQTDMACKHDWQIISQCHLTRHVKP